MRLRGIPMAHAPIRHQAGVPVAEYTRRMDMSELVLEHLRGIRASVDAVRVDVAEIKVRLLGVEQGINVLHQDVSNLRSIVGEQGARLDRLSLRVERIEQRLELVG